MVAKLVTKIGPGPNAESVCVYPSLSLGHWPIHCVECECWGKRAYDLGQLESCATIKQAMVMVCTAIRHWKLRIIDTYPCGEEKMRNSDNKIDDHGQVGWTKLVDQQYSQWAFRVSLDQVAC